MIETHQLPLIALLGLLGGILGGLLGLGGSVFIIPTLTLLLGPNVHLFQAAALIANVFVAGAATLRHRGRGTIRSDIVPAMAIAAGLGAVAGVLAGNQFNTRWMTGMFGIFLCYTALAELRGLVARSVDHPSPERSGTHRRRGAMVGLIGGFASGLLGIGGGAIMVPMLRRFLRLPLRESVASSAAAMIAACSVGASAKFVSVTTLDDPSGNPITREQVVLLAAVLSPCAMFGGSIGAALVYRLPLQAIRAILALLLAFAGVRMVLIGMSALR